MTEKDYLEAVLHFLREVDPNQDPTFTREALEATGINRKNLSFFRKHCASMSASELIALFRGLVLTEKYLQLSGGSVSSNIWLLRILSECLKPADTYNEIAWALENRGGNTYTPLGSLRGDRLFSEIGGEILKHCAEITFPALLPRSTCAKPKKGRCAKWQKIVIELRNKKNELRSIERGCRQVLIEQGILDQKLRN